MEPTQIDIPASLGPVPILAGDVLVNCTDLVNVETEQGFGRILQFDSDFRLKGVLLTGQEMGLISGGGFAPDGGVYYACDQTNRAITRFDRNGAKLADIAFGGSPPVGCIEFLADGTLLLGEHYCGTEEPHQGDGDLYHVTRDGQLLNRWDVQVHGGVAHFLGLNMMSLHPDGRTLVYVSETGNRVMRFDVAAQRQLPDLLVIEGAPFASMVFGLRCLPDGDVLVARGGGVWLLDGATGAHKRTYPLPGGRGWATVSLTPDSAAFYSVNFFAGSVVKVDRASGDLLAHITTGLTRCVTNACEAPPL